MQERLHGENSWDYRLALRKAFLKAKASPPGSSIRSFAKELGIGKTALSEAIAQKRHLSRHNALQVSAKLNFSPDDVRTMLAQIFQVEVTPKSIAPTLINEEHFRAISDWYHYAILSLARIPRGRADAHWIAAKLGISPLEARCALKRLVNLGMLNVKEGKLQRSCTPISPKGGLPSEAIRSFHRQTLHLAGETLENTPLDVREITGVTFPLDPKRIANAKRMIAQFQEELSTYLSGGTPSEVYHLGIQLFPLKRKPKVQSR